MDASVHVFPLRESLLGVAADLARSAEASHAVLTLDPRRFAAGSVGSPGLSRRIVEALHARDLGSIETGGQVFTDFASSSAHAELAADLSAAGLAMSVRLPLQGPGGPIGVAELFYPQSVEISEIQRVKLNLHVGHAAMNVLNVRLFNLVERAKKEWEGTF